MPAGERLVLVLSASTREGHVYRGDSGGDVEGQAAIRGELCTY